MAATQVRSAKTISAEGSSLPTTSYPREDMEEFLKAYESELDVEPFVVWFCQAKPLQCFEWKHIQPLA